ncbi:MAG: hypothetical protein QM831_25825 [Kofleriaceae bacterium]
MTDADLEPMIAAFSKRTSKTAQTLLWAFIAIGLIVGVGMFVTLSRRPTWSTSDSLVGGVYAMLFCFIPGVVVRNLMTKDIRRMPELRGAKRIQGELTKHTHDQVANMHYLNVAWLDGELRCQGIVETAELGGAISDSVIVMPIRRNAIGVVMAGALYLGNIADTKSETDENKIR